MPIRLADQQRLEAYLARRTQTAKAATGIAPRPPGAGAIPLSFAQQQIWLHAQRAPELPLYNEPLTIRKTGALDVAALQWALDELVRRHEAWRTTFEEQAGQPVQIVRAPFSMPLPLVDLADTPPAEREAEALRLATEDARRPFDLAQGALVRALLVRLGPEDHRLFLTVHHIVLDGVSIYRVLLPELTALYDARLAGRPSPLRALPVQYADFSLWQRERLGRETLTPSLAYWRARLADPPGLALPTDRPRPALQSFAGARHCFALCPPLTASLRSLARREGTSLFMTLLTGFQVLLHRLTGQDDLALGTVSGGRGRPEIERLLGFFANPVPLRADLRGDPTFRELLARVRDTTLEALAHDDVPFEMLVDTLGIERDPGRNPLFQVAFALEAPRAPWSAGWEAGHLDVDTETAKFDLYLELDERGDRLTGRIVYRTDLFDAATIARISDRYRHVLEALVADPGQRPSSLGLINEPERQELLAWGITRSSYPDAATVHGVFRDVAARTPDAVALIAGAEQVTYADLGRRAHRLAVQLRRLGVGPDTPVGVCLERSVELVVACLAILEAGGAYVPLDPTYPTSRLQFMLADAGARIVLTRASVHARVPLPDVKAVFVERLREAPAAEMQAPPGREAGPDDLAYVIYTSGSTGRPKGVAIPHRAILRLLFGQAYTRLDASRTLLFGSAISFDAATLELWGALLHGGRCVLLPGTTPTPATLRDTIRRHRVTTVWLTASLFNTVIDMAPETLAGVEELLTGGEALSPSHVRRALQQLPGLTIVNGYGPTECTTFACCHRLSGPPPPGATSIPIGRPIANTEAYVLDRHRQLAPLGATGELYLGGPGLARGYVNHPDLTAERFVEHPFDATPGARLYRTGDLARWRRDGVLEFLGRVDTQVKLRGFRIELGEVEAVLGSHPGVREAVVLARERALGARELVAYVVARAAPVDAGVLRDFLKSRLPAFMIPSAFVDVLSVPLTPVGKVDRTALAALGSLAATRPSSVGPPLPPRDPLEARLVALWEEVLGVHPIGVKDDFFALGGHSLDAVRIVQQVERLYGQTVPLGALHANACVEDLARLLLRRDREHPMPPLVTLQPQGSRRPFFFFHGDLNGGGFYCRELARQLGSDQPLVAIHPLGLDRRRVPSTIEAMAVEHLAQVRSVQPHGPYFIGGYCNGGLTAYEVARALAAAGETVEPVVLIAAAADTRLRRLRPLLDRLGCSLGLHDDEAAVYFGRLRYLADRFGAASTRGRARLAIGSVLTLMSEILARASGRALSPFARARIPADVGAAVRVADEMLSPEAYARYFAAVMAYVPRPFAGRLVVFWPSEQTPRRPDDPMLGWGPLVQHVEVLTVPGDHHTIVTRYTELIARTAQARRAAAGAGETVSAR